MTIELSPDQSRAADAIVTHFLQGQKEFVLAGLAGTGKTTILRYILAQLRPDFPSIKIAAPTGKAAQVLNRYLDGSGFRATTIHQLLYQPMGEIEDEETGRTELVFRERDHRELRAHLLVIDEASMVGMRMYSEIASRNVPTLWVGDHGQLAPIKSQDPRLMQRANFTLSRIHRQAEGSPILNLAYHVRSGGNLNTFFPGINRVQVRNLTALATEYIDREIDVVICSTNDVRMALNHKIREQRGCTDVLEPGDSIVCLLNNWSVPVVNGEHFSVLDVLDITPRLVTAVIQSENDMQRPIRINMLREQFDSSETLTKKGKPHTSLFTYGHAITCHKAQGSQWSHVGILNRDIWSNTRRYLYTAVTRAADHLTIFTPQGR